MLRGSLAILLFVLALSETARGQGDWEIVHHFDGEFDSVFAPQFLNEEYGFVIVKSQSRGFPQGTKSGIFRTTDGGKTFQESSFPRIEGVSVEKLAFRSPMRIYAAVRSDAHVAYQGLFRSDDSGMTWKRILQARTRSVAVSGSTIVCGGSISFDEGENWERLPIAREDFTSNGQGQIHLSAPPCQFKCPIGDRSFYSIDHGKTFDTTKPHPNGFIVTAIPHTGVLFMGCEEIGRELQPDSSIIVRSTDSGRTWESVYHVGVGHFVLTSGMASAGCAVYAQVCNETRMRNTGILRSTDFGTTWSQVGGPTGVRDTRISVVGRGAVVFANDGLGNLWRTTNGGDGTMKSSMLGGVNIKIGENFLMDTIEITPKQHLALDLHYDYCDVTWLEKAEVIGLDPSQYMVSGLDTLIRESAPLLSFLTINDIRPEQQKLTLKLTFRRDDWLRETKEIHLVVRTNQLAVTHKQASAY